MLTVATLSSCLAPVVLGRTMMIRFAAYRRQKVLLDIDIKPRLCGVVRNGARVVLEAQAIPERRRRTEIDRQPRPEDGERHPASELSNWRGLLVYPNLPPSSPDFPRRQLELSNSAPGYCFPASFDFALAHATRSPR
ncbi:hypothetical protein GE09DRAFT_491931 [Coniochaeta sp. 2T2.1]|nr:hypothetical protein GE09DRAFT_491931 [Coniochaeta sp. 2T2.1]